MTWLVFVAAVSLATGFVPARADAPHGATTTVTKSYIGSDLSPWAGAAVCSHADAWPGIGCVGFGRTDGAVITLSIYDDSGLPVGGEAHIGDGNGGVVYQRVFCGTSGPIPAVTGLLTVHLRAQSGLSLACPPDGSAVATKGHVQAIFTATDQ